MLYTAHLSLGLKLLQEDGSDGVQRAPLGLDLADSTRELAAMAYHAHLLV